MSFVQFQDGNLVRVFPEAHPQAHPEMSARPDKTTFTAATLVPSTASIGLITKDFLERQRQALQEHLENQIKGLTQEIQILVQDKKELAGKLATDSRRLELTNSHCENLGNENIKLKEQLRSLEEEFRMTKEALEQNLDKEKRMFVDFVRRQKDEDAQNVLQISSMKQSLSSSQSHVFVLKEQLEEATTQLEDAKKEHAQELKDAEANAWMQIKSFQDHFAKEMAKLADEHAQILKKAQSIFDEKLLSSQCVGVDRQNELLRRLDDQLQAHFEEMTNLEKAKADQKQAHDQQLADQKQAHDQQLADQQHAHDQQLVVKQQAHDQQLADQKEVFDKEMAAQQENFERIMGKMTLMFYSSKALQS